MTCGQIPGICMNISSRIRIAGLMPCGTARLKTTITPGLGTVTEPITCRDRGPIGMLLIQAAQLGPGTVADATPGCAAKEAAVSDEPGSVSVNSCAALGRPIVLAPTTAPCSTVNAVTVRCPVVNPLSNTLCSMTLKAWVAGPAWN